MAVRSLSAALIVQKHMELFSLPDRFFADVNEFLFFFPHGKIALLQGMKVWGRRGWGGCGRAAEPKFGINCGCVFFSKNLTFIFMKLGKDPLPPSLASPPPSAAGYV